MEILILLILYPIKHWYADFKIQTYQQVVRKGIYRDLVGISHSLDHVIYSLIALLIFSLIHPIAPIAILAVSWFEGVVHYHIDWVKMHFGSKDMCSPVFWNQFGLDQLAHQLTYLAIVWYLML